MKMNKQKVESVEWLTKGLTEEQLEEERVLAIISAKICLIRQSLGMDQKTFAKKTGVSQGMVSRWESGEYNFTFSTITKICAALGYRFEPQLVEKEECKEECKETIRSVRFGERADDESIIWIPRFNEQSVGGLAS